MNVLVIDIGGGSIEVTLASDSNIQATVSFNMGTVRLLQKLGQAKVGEQRFPTALCTVIRAFEPMLRHSTSWPRLMKTINLA